MAHLHEVRDIDTHYTLDVTTMQFSNNSSKNTLMQGDHNSEVFTFEVPKVMEGHDMSICNSVRIHYNNISSDKAYQSKDVYEVKDVKEEGEKLVFSWTISGNATMYAGNLNFRILFACVDEAGKHTYKKWTDVYKGITIKDGFDNGEAVAKDFSDVLEQWKIELEEQIAETEAHIEEVEAKVEEVETKVTEVEAKVIENETKIAETETKVANIEGSLQDEILSMLEATGTVKLAHTDENTVYTDENGAILML